MSAFDDFLAAAPQHIRDRAEVGRMESMNRIDEAVFMASDAGVKLGAKDGDDVFVNVNLITNMVSMMIPTMLTSPDPNFRQFGASLMEAVIAAKRSVGVQ